ncbi:MAG: AAA-associated domain-containing protein [Candidatus Binataceae bacterium]
MMCDRILVLSSNPGRISAEIPVPLPHPRNRLDTDFHSIVDEFYSILTSRTTESIGAQSQIHGGLVQSLPPVPINRLGGFIEALASPPYQGRAELAKIAGALALDIRDLFLIAEALHILEFAELKDGAIRLTAAGSVFAHSATDERKRLFKEHLLQFVPLAVHIRHILDEREGHVAPRERFEPELEDHLNPNDAENTLQAVIGWGRYADLFTYDDETRTFSTTNNSAS